MGNPITSSCRRKTADAVKGPLSGKRLWAYVSTPHNHRRSVGQGNLNPQTSRGYPRTTTPDNNTNYERFNRNKRISDSKMHYYRCCWQSYGHLLQTRGLGVLSCFYHTGETPAGKYTTGNYLDGSSVDNFLPCCFP